MLRAGQKLGKYRIEQRLAKSSFAYVYQAFDTIEGTRVALKMPHPSVTDKEFLEEFRKEVRLAAQLDHRNILPVKNASFVDGKFVIVMPLGERTLADRLRSRVAVKTALQYSEQMLVAVAHAHDRYIIHCDIKPENFILFDDGHLRLADFGIAKVAMRTLRASGSGTIGYVAPEQAMGRPSFPSDVFSLGLIMYRMLTGQLPEWPYEWPPPGHDRLRGRVHPDLIAFLRRALEVKPARRFRDARYMLTEFQRIKPRVLRYLSAPRRAGSRSAPRRGERRREPHWREVRFKQFRRRFGRALAAHHDCSRCGGPVAEAMQACPWCGHARKAHHGDTSFPAHCPRCRRGVKLDWRFCAWCYGAGFEPHGAREYPDKRYTARCGNSRCSRRELMPFMRYCPWCRTKVKHKWKISGSRDRCSACGWGVVKEFWNHCPWCRKKLERR